MKLRIFTTGGTIDKVYFDAKSEYEVGEPVVGRILHDAGVAIDFEITELLKKDSLDVDDADRARIRAAVESDPAERILITHGTDTMADTGRALLGVPGKTVVLTGSLSPARFQNSDAVFNVGCAVGAVQSLPPGVYVAMNGRIFTADTVRKNRDANRFEEVKSER
ncbi:MAG TPA: asparaginase domain-containing protein [Gammaproteobacteria bacterium]